MTASASATDEKEGRPSTQAPLLEATGIAMGYDDRLVLSGVSLTMGAGDCIILKGDNGTGKTTLLRGLAGLAPLITGTVKIGGVNLNDDRVHASRRLLYIGHRDGLAAELTVREALNLWASSRGFAISQDNMDEGLNRLGIGGISGRLIRTLSAGQKRRAAMARLGIMISLGRTDETPLWLLDEPATAMDNTATGHFTRLVEDHLTAGGAVLMTSHHDLPVASARSMMITDLDQGCSNRGKGDQDSDHD